MEHEYAIELLDVIGFDPRCKMKGMEVCPIFRDRKQDLIIFPPFCLKDERVVGGRIGSNGEFVALEGMKRITEIKTSFPAKPGFVLWVDEKLMLHYDPRAPYSFYNQHEDCIHMMFKVGCDYAWWVDDGVTVYRDIKTRELLGCIIKSASSLFKKDSITIATQSRKVSIRDLLLVQAEVLESQKNQPLQISLYKEIYQAIPKDQTIEIPEEIGVVVE